MKTSRRVVAMICGLLATALSILAGTAVAAATETSKPSAIVATPRTGAAHPDLSGNWAGTTGATVIQAFPSTRSADGSINAGLTTPADAQKFAAFLKAAGENAGRSLPGGAQAPQYKDPADQAKAEQLYQAGSKTDRVVACGQPGLPRVGAPGKIVQTSGEVIFLYADLAGMVWRIIPIDGRGFRDRADPSFYGDSIGRWEGDTLVVETRNFTTETWFGEYGYFHSDKMRVIERLSRKGDTLTYQATVEDPQLLKQPWVKAPVIMKLTKETLEEPLECITPTYVEEAGHHEQRAP
jgi:hypothetical protein